MLLTVKDLINAIYIRIAGIARDASAHGHIVDDLTVAVGAARAGTRISALGADAG